MVNNAQDLARFYDNYRKALARWKQELPHALESAEFIELSRIQVDDLPESSLTIHPSYAELSFTIYEHGKAQEIWRDSYESLQELEREWFCLSYDELYAKHLTELEAFFSDIDE